MSCLIEPVTLSGQYAWLEPFGPEHEDEVCAAAVDGELWKPWYTSVPSPDKASEWLAIALDVREHLGAVLFVVCGTRDRQLDKVVGAARLFNVDKANRQLEAGHTWYVKSVRRTVVNTERELLLLTHAPKTLRYIAVKFRIHQMSRQSRAAIARLGAKQDGVLRNHQRMPDGSFHDMVMFSIIESKWLIVKRHLQYELE